VTVSRKLSSKGGITNNGMKTHSKKCASSGRAVSLCDCDSYHTFDELYDHRITLWIALLRVINRADDGIEIIRSKVNGDGTVWDGWFILGMYGDEDGQQITYHLPMSRWDECAFAETLDKPPEFDGHTSDDVLARLKTL
jgi:hypothetical protein